MAIERGHLSVFTKWMLWSDTPVRGRKSTLPNPYFYFVFCFLFFPPKHTEHLDFHDKDDEPLYRPGNDDDVAPLDLGETKSS